MDAITDPKQAGERLLQFAREGRLRRTVWRAEVDGREVACLLGAAAGIEGVKQCPASLMPQWLAWALPGLFDGQTPAHAMTFACRWGEAMVRDEWPRIDWDAVRGEWMVFIVQQAEDAAYDVYSSCAALFATRSADHAADAANAASYAAEAAAAHAARASYAADAAARAADADAADAARADARDAQADALMDAIERAMEVGRRLGPVLNRLTVAIHREEDHRG